MKIPSNKLLLEITNLNVIDSKIEGTYLKYKIQTDIGKVWIDVNIYEMMHNMKVWAAYKNFKLTIELSYGVERGQAKLEQYQEFDVYDTFGYKIGRTAKSDWFKENSEFEAAVAACEWIVENTK